jgi:hypothetical protein
MRIALVLATLFTVGCVDIRQEYSETIQEDAVIENVIYTPSRHETELGFTALKSGPFGMDYGGNVGMRIGKHLQVNNVTVPEKFAVVFKCRHGQFIVGRKEVYERFKDAKGTTVEVSYREVYRTRYEKEGDTSKVVERSLVDYDFLDARHK